MRLVKKISGKAGQGAKGDKSALFPAAHNPASYPEGIVVDGELQRLAGEPSLGKSQGWGDMRWLFG